MTLWKSGVLLGAVCALASAAFAGDAKPVTGPDGLWRLEAPADWKVEHAGSWTLAASPDGTATVVVFTAARSAGTLEDWLAALVPQLQAEIPGWTLGASRPQQVGGLEALRFVAASRRQGAPMHADCLLVRGERLQAMLTCNCPASDAERWQSAFDGILASLRFPPASEAAAPPRRPKPGAPKPVRVEWEAYVSKHLTFTLRKPKGWKVKENWREKPTKWAVGVRSPDGAYKIAHVHGVSPTGDDADALVRKVIREDYLPATGMKVARTARVKVVGARKIFLFEGTFGVEGGPRREFSSLVAGGDGLMLHQRIEAPAGRLEEFAPVLLQTLANIRVAKHVFLFDEGARRVRSAGPRPAPIPNLVRRPLAGGWGAYWAPADWKQADLGKGMVIASDPTESAVFVAANAEFISPRYAHLVRMPGLLVSEFCAPHEAMRQACETNGFGSGFRFDVTRRPEICGFLRAGLTGSRPCASEHFFYSFTREGEAYKGFSLGWCVGNHMDAGFTFGHITAWAPAARFDAWMPLLGRIMASYELNQQRVGEYVAAGLRAYYRGLAELSGAIAANSEQIRRENLQLHMERGRVQDYTSYLTTRMIMGEFDYLAGSAGYVRADPSGLYTADGNVLSRVPYGGNVTRHMTEINSRALYEAVRPR